MKVLYLTNIPSPYRVDFFNELGKLCDLTVLFERAASSERDESWKEHRFKNFRGIILNGISAGVDTAFSLKAVKNIKKNKYDAIICGGISSPTAILTICYMKKKGIDYYIEADGATAKNGKGLKEKLKKYLITGAKGYFSSSNLCDEYFTAYGAKKERIHRYPFTSLYNSDIIKKPISSKEKTLLREELGLTENKILVSVGRFSYLNGYGKGYDTLLKASEKLPKNIGFYIIGDEPTEEFRNLKEEKNLTNVHFLQFKQKQELFKYYKAADMSLLLTRGEAWGLVVNESMANGTPVITTDACVAGLELIKDGQNGFIVEVDAIEQVCKNIEKALSDDEFLSEMSKSALKTIRSFTIEQMAKLHKEVLFKHD